MVRDGLQVTHQELESLIVVSWQVPDLWEALGHPSAHPPPRSPCPPTLPHLPTSFRSVLILSLASSIRLASMKSLYLSEWDTEGSGPA